MKKYLSISLLHPKIVRGGSQQIAYELFEAATTDDEISHAHFLAGVDPALDNVSTPPGAVFTGMDGQENENILISHNFNAAYHLQTNWFVIDKINEFFAEHKFDWIHFHHSLFVGLEMLDIVKKHQPDAKIFYTLHEYLPICTADGQLKKTYNNSLCYDPSESACFKCFPELNQDFFFIRNQMFKSKFSNVDHFITPSEFSRNVFLDWGLSPEKISVIPNGQKNINPNSALENKPTVKKNGEAIKFAFFGQMIDNKGAHLLIEAAKIMDKSGNNSDFSSNFEIHIYGGGKQFASDEYRQKMDSLINSCSDNLKGRLYFHGEYTHEQLPDIFRSVDCVVVPSTWFEVFGLVVSEAWMFGKPVIVSDIGGLGERVQDGVNGLKFIPNNSSDLANKMHIMAEEYLYKGKVFPGIKPPIDRETFWNLHKALFQKN